MLFPQQLLFSLWFYRRFGPSKFFSCYVANYFAEQQRIPGPREMLIFIRLIAHLQGRHNRCK